MSCSRTLLLFAVIQVSVGDYCYTEEPRTLPINECPGKNSRVYSVGDNAVRIGGMFSISQWNIIQKRLMGTTGECSACHNGSRQLQLFAIEQAEALIRAVELINESDLLGNTNLIYDIWDTCGGQMTSACIKRQAHELHYTYEVLATILGPYYSDISFSMKEEELVKLYSTLGQGIRGTNAVIIKKGVWSLLDYPYRYTLDLDEEVNSYLETQVIMLQQTCEIQAAAAVDFLVEEGWYDVTMVASNDYCGIWAIAKFYEGVNRSLSHCHFDIRYVKEHTFAEAPAEFQEPNPMLSELVGSDNFLSERNDATTFDQIQERKNSTIVVLSSIPHALFVLSELQDSPLDTNYTILLGDLWGDPRNVNELYGVITNLVEKGHHIYSLRAESNGTEKFQSYMASIRSNSSQLLRNHWLKEYWEDHFNCSISLGTCDVNDRLTGQNRPILRNYKAPLVMDAVYATAMFLRDFHEKYSGTGVLDGFFKPDFYKLKVGGQLMVTNEWTGNTMIIGEDLGGPYNFDWVQPHNWAYEIVQLQSEGNSTEVGYKIYGKWVLESINGTKGSITLFRNHTVKTVKSCDLPIATSQRPSSSPTPSSSPESCDEKEVDTMAGLVAIVTILLLTTSLIYLICLMKYTRDATRLIFYSVGKDILMINSLVSIGISFWIALGEVVFECESRAVDFAVNFTNTVCYSVIFLRLMSKKFEFERPIKRFCFCVVGFIVLLGVQSVISALAHFYFASNRDGMPRTTHCSEERKKPLVVVSYWYSVILLSASVLLYLNRRCYKEGSRIKSFVKVVIAIATASFYAILTSLFLWADDSNCMAHARFLVVISLYPSVVCFAVVIVTTATHLYKEYCCKKETGLPELQLPGNPTIMELL